MELSPIVRALRASGFYARRFSLGLPMGLLLSQNAWADPGTVNVGNASVTNNGTATTLTFPVTRTGDASYASIFNFNTQDGSATAPTDYVSRSGSLTIPAGSTAASLAITIPGQGPQADKDLFLQLLGATGLGPTPSLAAEQTFFTGVAPRSVASADFNGDGKADLLVANYADNTVSVLGNFTSPGATAPTYGAQQVFAAGTHPTAAVAADVNGDGKPDILVSDFTGAVSVLINTTTAGASNPSFAAPQSFAAGATPLALSTADVNGDGRPDVLVANYSPNTVTVLVNATTPGSTVATYGTPQTFAAGTRPFAIIAADVNGDGKRDLVVANYADNTVSVLINATAPGVSIPAYAPQQTFTTGAGPQYLAAADLNGDGKIDLLVADKTGNAVSVLLNNATAGASSASYAAQQSFAAGTQPRAVAIADLNGDGKPDLLVANYADNTVSLLMSTTPAGATIPSYAAQRTFAATGPFALNTGDVNGDGKPDLLLASRGNGTVSVLLNATPGPATTFDTGSFAARQTFSSVHPGSIRTADVNGDGKPDLVTNVYYPGVTSGVGVLLNTTAAGATIPSYAAMTTFALFAAVNFVVTADVNGDGKPDLLTANYPTGVAVLLNTTASGATTPSYAAEQTFATGQNPVSMAIADVNGDGKPDLLVANDADYTVSVLLNTTITGATAPSYAAQSTFAVTSGTQAAVTIADVNGDGKPDLLVTSSNGNNTVSVLLNTTAAGATLPSYAAEQTFAVGGHSWSVSAADVNGDGKPDLLVGNYSDNSISVLLNTTVPGATISSFTGQQTFATGTGPLSLTTADVDGDGRLDLVVVNHSNSISILRNITAAGATSPGFATQQTFATPFPIDLTVADVNGDGKPDLLTTSFLAGGGIFVLLNTQYQSSASATAGDGTIHFQAADPTPDAFSFTALKNAPVNTVETSNTIHVTGINVPVPVTFRGSGAYSINGGAYGTADSTVNNGDTISVRLTSASTYKTAVHGGVVIGSVGGAYIVTTGIDPNIDTTPDAFAFTAVRNASLSSPVDSNVVTITGINVPTPVSVSGGGSYSIAGGAFTTAAGSISNGQTVQLRLTSAATPGTALHAGLRVGTGSAPFVVTTAR